MKEVGQVTQIQDTIATVRTQRNSSCGSCNACSMGQNQDEMFIKVLNELDAKPGDWVELDLESISILKISSIVYMIPLVALILGLIGGYTLAEYFSGNPELYGALGGLLATVLAFLGIRIAEPRFNKKKEYTPRMISIVKQ